MINFDRDFESECEKHLAYLYQVAQIRFPDCPDTDELVQETMVVFLSKLRSGEHIEKPKSFLSAVLQKKYLSYLRKQYKNRTLSYIEDVDCTTDEPLFEEEEQYKMEEYEAIRREIGRLVRIYREVTVRHYVHGQGVEQISREMGIPRGTVLYRLSAARGMIKEGLNKMEKYAQVSYEPKSVRLSAWGYAGLSGEPYSLQSSHIESNILILAYENPVSIRGIADTMGMPCAYLEPIVEKLVEGELMGKTSGGLVYTRCFMQPFDDFFGNIPAQEHLAKARAKEVWDVAWKHLSPLLDRPEGRAMSDKQKATLVLLMIVRTLLECVHKDTKPTYEGSPTQPPHRPNAGRWLATGLIFEHGQDISNQYFCAGPVEVGYREKSYGPRTCKMYDFHSCFGDAYFVYRNLKYVPKLNSILRLYASLLPNGVEIDNNKILELIPDFERLCIMKRDEDGEIHLDIPALTYDEYQTYWSAAKAAMRKEFGEFLADDLRKLWLEWKNRVPKHVDEAEYFRHAGALGAYPIAQLLAIVDQNLLPWTITVGKTPLILVLYRKKEEA